jgi:hypothetical protein
MAPQQGNDKGNGGMATVSLVLMRE